MRTRPTGTISSDFYRLANSVHQTASTAGWTSVFHFTILGTEILMLVPVCPLTFRRAVVNHLAFLAQKTRYNRLAGNADPVVFLFVLASYRTQVVDFGFILRRTDAETEESVNFLVVNAGLNTSTECVSQHSWTDNIFRLRDYRDRW